MAWGKRKDPRVAFERGIDVSMLSSTGLAYRRCELVRVNSSEIGVRFLRAEHPKSKHVHRSAAPARTLQAGSGRRPRPPNRQPASVPIEGVSCRWDAREEKDETCRSWSAARRNGSLLLATS